MARTGPKRTPGERCVVVVELELGEAAQPLELEFLGKVEAAGNIVLCTIKSRRVQRILLEGAMRRGARTS